MHGFFYELICDTPCLHCSHRDSSPAWATLIAAGRWLGRGKIQPAEKILVRYAGLFVSSHSDTLPESLGNLLFCRANLAEGHCYHSRERGSTVTLFFPGQ